MITGDGRIDFAKESIRCFLDQTYKNKELIIVTDGSTEYKSQLKDCVDSEGNIKLVCLTGRYTLGALRNISIGLCDGDFMVQWDDDDFNMPERLSVQYNWLSKSDKTVCYLGDQLHYYFPNQELYWENWWQYQSGMSIKYGLIPGTLMASRVNFDARYPSAGRHAKAGEDSVLSDELDSKNKITLMKGWGNIQIYSYHGKNVWDLEHHLNISKNRSHDVAFMN